MNPLYTASVTSVGGRNGHVESSDGAVKLTLAAPPALGGNGKGANPEQLFAAGYAACFAGAMDYIAHQQKLTPGEITIASKVAIGPDTSGAFTLAVEMDILAPGLDQAAAEELVAQADKVCPYSRATRGNIKVKLTAQGGKG
jgi:osmotically inducible protein OsmC